MGETTDPLTREQYAYAGTDDDSRTVYVTEGENTQAVDEKAEIRENIEQTRAQMSGTIDAIQERLDPANLKEQVVEQLREQLDEAGAMLRQATIGRVEDMVHSAGESVKDARYTLGETIRENPIPAALVGIGLGWLLMNARGVASRRERYNERRLNPNARRGDSYDRYSGLASTPQNEYDPRLRYDGRRDEPGYVEQGQKAISHAYDRVQRTAGEFVEQAKGTATDVVDQARETAGEFAEQVRHQAERVEDRFQDALHENPLAVGALALAVGTAIGFVLPQTRRENKLMGETRDSLVDKAQEVAQETVEQVRTAAQKVTTEVQNAIGGDEITQKHVVNM